jgi:hypothetical protein
VSVSIHCIICGYCQCCRVIISDDFLGDTDVEYESEVSLLAEQLRQLAQEMIDLLDMQLPLVSRLKV